MKIATHGLFGWVAIGIENPGGGHNGMDGAQIVMATPGPAETYSAKFGLNTVNSGPEVAEYTINDDGRGAAFRLWNTPHPTSSISEASVTVDGCFSSMSFSTAVISGKPLNLAGSDDMIWAFNGADTFVGYHSRENRGKIKIDWAAATLPPSPDASSMPSMGGASLSTGAWIGIAIGSAAVTLIGGIAVGMHLATSKVSSASKATKSTRANGDISGDVNVKV